MNKITIEKKSEEVTYRQVETTIEFRINGKLLRLYLHEKTDDLDGNDYDIDEEDKFNLTEEEYEVFEDQGLWELARMKDGETLQVDGWEE